MTQPQKLVPPQKPGKTDVLLVIFQRGACDGLNFVPPMAGEDRQAYEQERPNLKMPTEGPEALLPLDGKFGLHPKATALHRLYQQKKLAIIHAVGSPLNSRSHFDAQNLMELGIVENRILGTGWMTRLLAKMNLHSSEIPALAAGPFLPTALLGFDRAISVNSLDRLNLGGINDLQDEQLKILESLYSEGSTFLHQAGHEALDSLNHLRKATAATPPTNLDFPKSEIGGRLKTLSQVLKLNLGLRMASIDMGGWDTHKNQGSGLDGQFAKQVEQLSDGLGAFYQDLQNHPNLPSVTTLVMTEFGRRLRENANRGTDHGHGGVAFVMGPSINGGKVLGPWPGLKTEQLYERADLAVTTDYRQVILELAQGLAPNLTARDLFPQFHPAPALKSFNFFS